MSTFVTELKMKAAITQVWQTLADIGTIHRWNPGVIDSYINTEQTQGVGAGRYCDLGSNTYLNEAVVAWEEGKHLTMRIIGTNLPFKTADIHFTLREDNGDTVVTVSPEYTLKFGPIGKLLNRFYVQRTYQQGMDALLAGLKQYVEEGENVK